MTQYDRQTKIVIALGSNLGDCSANLEQAVRKMEAFFGAPLVCSSVYRSEPVEVRDQPWFLNQVAYFETDAPLPPLVILKNLKAIEAQMGRIPGARYGPRLIDLDLLFYGDWVLETANLTVPHPKLEERSFVLMPLVEILPDFIHPRTGIPLTEILEQNRPRLARCERMVQ
ncbi:2-amino-4-hydroxy-6-hydroxymethyldihydropteridine diphosphokinase [Hydrogenispora ethanolica]|uniref:2-amino-4-hydroxy-6-hydroxymethyldihydropteridine diphosphokinase n=1 Tax=Hydrogenispora ethanolica TaxID=1082276 RepID=A0A4R1RE76_HYDET|nr:2-amino-4-hydroxy-6-hydroxymethyldihydropteridine diphosphokinase [Hydrogenispora ethanolica]